MKRTKKCAVIFHLDKEKNHQAKLHNGLLYEMK